VTRGLNSEQYVTLVFGRVMCECVFTVEWRMTAVTMNLCVTEYITCHTMMSHFLTNKRNVLLC